MESLDPLRPAPATRGRKAASELLPILYEELRSQARMRLAQARPGQTLQATALVHEAYLRLVATGDRGWDSRHHFYSAAGQAMRDILVEQARRKAALRHGGDRSRVELVDAIAAFEPPVENVLGVDRALTKLEQHDARAARLVVLRFFAGMTMGGAAAAMKISERTARREWSYARAWLQREIERESAAEPSEP